MGAGKRIAYYVYFFFSCVLLSGCLSDSKVSSYKPIVLPKPPRLHKIQKKKPAKKEIVKELLERVKAHCIRVLNIQELVIDIGGRKRRVSLLGMYGPSPDDTHFSVRKRGDVATEILRKKIEKKIIFIEFDYHETPFNTRWKVYVFLPEGDFINADLVLEGHARVDRSRKFRYMKDFLRMEKTAIKHGRGFWKNLLKTKRKPPLRKPDLGIKLK